MSAPANIHDAGPPLLALLLAVLAVAVDAEAQGLPVGAGPAAIEAAIEDHLSFDLASMLPPSAPLVTDFCVEDGGFLGCLGSVDVSIANPLADLSGLDANVVSLDYPIVVDLTLLGITVNSFVSGAGLAPSCFLETSWAASSVTGFFDLDPLSGGGIDATQLGSALVSLGDPSTVMSFGTCDLMDSDIITLVQGIESVLESMLGPGLEGYLDAVDAEGNTPIAAAIESGVPVPLPALGPSGRGVAGILLALAVPAFAHRVRSKSSRSLARAGSRGSASLGVERGRVLSCGEPFDGAAGEVELHRDQ